MTIAIVIVVNIVDNAMMTTTIATIVPAVFEVALTAIKMIVIRRPSLRVFFVGGGRRMQ